MAKFLHTINYNTMKKAFETTLLSAWLIVAAIWFCFAVRAFSQNEPQINCGITVNFSDVLFQTQHGAFCAEVDSNKVCHISFSENCEHVEGGTISVRTHFFCAKNEDVKQRVGKTVWLTKLGENTTYENFLAESGMSSGIHSREAYAHSRALSTAMYNRFPACCITELQSRICVQK